MNIMITMMVIVISGTLVVSNLTHRGKVLGT